MFMGSSVQNLIARYGNTVIPEFWISNQLQYTTLLSFQAAIIARKKESTAEKLNDSRNELATLEEEIGDKRAQVQSLTSP